jgi:hypothetical protein
MSEARNIPQSVASLPSTVEVVWADNAIIERKVLDGFVLWGELFVSCETPSGHHHYVHYETGYAISRARSLEQAYEDATGALSMVDEARLARAIRSRIQDRELLEAA